MRHGAHSWQPVLALVLVASVGCAGGGGGSSSSGSSTSASPQPTTTPLTITTADWFSTAIPDGVIPRRSLPRDLLFSLAGKTPTGGRSVTITKTIDFVVDESVFVVKPQLNDAWQDQSFSYSFTAVNGVPPYHWSETGLPGALALDPDTGQLSGIPTAAGTSKYNITVTDSSIPALSDTRAVTIGVRDRLEFAGVLRPLLLRDGRNFDESIPLRGGSGNYVWTLVSGQLPPGISLTQQGGFRGVATQAGSYPIRVEVRDFSPGPYVVQGDFTITVIPPPLGLNTFPLLLAPATRGAPYHSQLGPAVDGVAPYQWSISAGQVPPGLVLDQATGAIDGVPTQVGRFPFQVLVRDSDTPAQSISRWSAIEVRSSLGRNDSIQTATSIGNFGTEASISPFLDPVTSSLPNPDQDYYRIMAIGGTAARVRVSPREQLDSVLELFNENGQRLQSCGPSSYTSSCLNDDSIGDGGNITLGSTLDFAVPGAPGSPTTFYARVFDWRGNARPDMLYTLSVLGAIDPLKIEQSSLGPGGIRGVNYRKQLTSNGGKGSVTWSLAAGAVPPGWSISSGGLLSGVAAALGTYTFSIRATDSENPAQSAQQDFTVQIADPLRITSSPASPTVCLGQPYSIPIEFAGGHPPYFFGFGPLLGIDGSMRAYLAGFANLLGPSLVTLTISDSAEPANSDSRQLTLNVVNCP